MYNPFETWDSFIGEVLWPVFLIMIGIAIGVMIVTIFRRLHKEWGNSKKISKHHTSEQETREFYEWVYASEHSLKEAMKKIALVPNEERMGARDPLLRCRNQILLLMDLCDVCHTCHQIKED